MDSDYDSDSESKSEILMGLFADDLNNGKVFYKKLFRRAYYFGIRISDIEDIIQD